MSVLERCQYNEGSDYMLLQLPCIQLPALNNNISVDSFERSYPYPSFNVKDLHTVDNGVISHLIPEIRKHDWNVIIAHFLGVDHCGHRYGPYHSAMAEKLTQMDEVLR